MLDNAFTQELQQWVNTPDTERDLAQGALLLYRLTGNAYAYQQALVRPAAYAATLDHELKKHLAIRLDGLMRQEVAQIEREALPRIAKTLKEPSPLETTAPVVSTDTEKPEAQHAGRRKDHDKLPQEIQDLYTQNGELYHKMKLLFNQLKAMKEAQPCDRYELLKQLRAADDKYRANWAKYDEYKV